MLLFDVLLFAVAVAVLPNAVAALSALLVFLWARRVVVMLAAAGLAALAFVTLGGRPLSRWLEFNRPVRRLADTAGDWSRRAETGDAWASRRDAGRYRSSYPGRRDRYAAFDDNE